MQRVCVQKGPLDRCPQGPARIQLGPTVGAALEVTQHLVVGFHEQLLAQERIGKIANLTALHDQSAFGYGPWLRRLVTSAYVASSRRSNARPRWSRDMTVPMGRLRAAAISL